jgi:hypothetical protein
MWDLNPQYKLPLLLFGLDFDSGAVSGDFVHQVADIP